MDPFGKTDTDLQLHWPKHAPPPTRLRIEWQGVEPSAKASGGGPETLSSSSEAVSIGSSWHARYGFAHMSFAGANWLCEEPAIQACSSEADGGMQELQLSR